MKTIKAEVLKKGLNGSTRPRSNEVQSILKDKIAPIVFLAVFPHRAASIFRDPAGFISNLRKRGIKKEQKDRLRAKKK